MENKYTRDQIKDAIWQELKESDYTGENNERAYEVIGIVMAGIDKIGGEVRTGPVWVKGAPTERKLFHARFKGHLSDDIHDGTIEPVKDPEYWQAIASGVRISIKGHHIIEYLDESDSAPSGERESDAVAFNIYCTDSYYYENGFWWHKENHDPYSVDQLYDIFKQQKEG